MMFEKLKLNDRILKNVINLTFLALSSFLIVYFLIQLTDKPYIKVGFSLFAIILEIFMQYLLGTGRAKWQYGDKIQAGVLFFCYGLYVLVYAVPSATGFFMAEINNQEQISARIAIAEDTGQRRLTQINTTIANLNAQLATESKSGYGKRSQLIMAEIKQLTAEQGAIQSHFQNVPALKTTGRTDLFNILGNVFKIPGNVLKIIIFGISIVMIYVGLIMTSWDIRLSPASASSAAEKAGLESVLETGGLCGPALLTGTARQIPESREKFCPACGKLFPDLPDKIFSSANCRLTHHNKSPAQGVI